MHIPSPQFDIDAMTSRAIHAFAQSNGHGQGPKVVIEKMEFNVSGGMDDETWKRRKEETIAEMMVKIAELIDQS